MNTSDLYIGIIRKVIKIDYIPIGDTFIEILLQSQKKVDTELIKVALLRKKSDQYIDLETNIKYTTNTYKVGTFFVHEQDLQPYNEIFKDEITKHITKRKALTKFNEIK